MELMTLKTTDGLRILIGTSFPKENYLLPIFLKSGNINLSSLIKFEYSKAGDTSNFSEYPDSDTLSPEVSKKDDPFLDW